MDPRLGTRNEKDIEAASRLETCADIVELSVSKLFEVEYEALRQSCDHL